MCGRYSLNLHKNNLAQRFEFDPARCNHTPNPNLAPSHSCLAVAAPKGERLPATMTWGFINPWADNSNRPNSPRIINARSETAADKQIFSESFRKRRCIIPADAFFESKNTPQGRQTFRISLTSQVPFAMAGIWKPRKTQANRTEFEFVILTVPPNPEVRRVHDRMPAILLPQDEELWLNSDIQDPAKLSRVLKPYPAHMMWVHQPNRHQPNRHQPNRRQPNTASTIPDQPATALLGT